MQSQRLVASALAGALVVAVATPSAEAVVVARVTQRGYVVVDEPDVSDYGGMAPVGNSNATLLFAGELTAAIDAVNGPHADYIAVMQTDFVNSPLAFYIGIKNDVLGIGQRDPRSTRETFDLNSVANSTWPLTGFVFLNSLGLYTDPARASFGPDTICTQEFGHRFSAFTRIPPQPGSPTPPAPDAGAGDPDAGEPMGGGGPDLAADALLGRQRAHWSYFVESGGSPMEGNAWAEISPGVFRTQAYTPRFSPLDMYLMGLIPPSEVPPFFVIAEPNVLGQRDNNGVVIYRESPPANRNNARPITIRGRRVTYTIDDVIRANGPRVPAYQAPGTADGGAGAPTDMNVTWVLFTTRERVTDALVADFDRAIDACARGYADAADRRSALIPIVLQQAGDAGPADADTDAAADAAEGGNADVASADGALASDVAVDGSERPALTAAGGCGCRAAGARRASPAGLAVVSLALTAAVAARRRARRRGPTRRDVLSPDPS